MMKSKFQVFEALAFDIGRAAHNWSADTLRLLLSDQALNGKRDKTVTDVAEIAAQDGYPKGGVVLKHKWRIDAANPGRAVLWIDDVTIKANSGRIGPFRYGVVANTSAKGRPLIGFVDLGESTTSEVRFSFRGAFSLDLKSQDGKSPPMSGRW